MLAQEVLAASACVAAAFHGRDLASPIPKSQALAQVAHCLDGEEDLRLSQHLPVAPQPATLSAYSQVKSFPKICLLSIILSIFYVPFTS